MHVNTRRRAVSKTLNKQAKRSIRTKPTVRDRVRRIFGAEANDIGGTLVHTIGLVLSRFSSGLPPHLCSLSFKDQGAFAT